MCIIVYKPRGRALPEEALLRRCFNRNSHGAGMMYVAKDEKDERKIIIDKGYLNFNIFYDKIKSLEEDGILREDEMAVFHFRIGTSGGRTPSKTHPFPLTKNVDLLNKLNLVTDIGMAHNGIIGEPKVATLSDTQEFIIKYLSSKKQIDLVLKKNKKFHKLINKEGNFSRFLFLTKDNATMLGSGWIPDDGLHFSNNGFKPYATTSYTSLDYYKNLCGHQPTVPKPEVIDARDKFPCELTPEERKREVFKTIVIDFWRYFINPLGEFDYTKALELVYEEHKDKVDLSYAEKRKIGFNW